MFYAWADICSLYSFGVIPTCLRNSLWKLLLSATPTKVCTDDVEASSSLSRRLASSTRRSSRQVRKVVCMRLEEMKSAQSGRVSMLAKLDLWFLL